MDLQTIIISLPELLLIDIGLLLIYLSQRICCLKVYNVEKDAWVV